MMQFPRQGPDITWRSVVALCVAGAMCLYVWYLLWYILGALWYMIAR